MPYNNNIPLGTDKTKKSVSDIQKNYQFYFDTFNINHFAMDAIHDGSHRYLDFPEQGADPTTAVNEGAVYTKQGAVSGETELYWRRENNGLGLPFTEGTKASLGWSSVPSGLVTKWGSFTPAVMTATGNQSYGIGVAFSAVVFIEVNVYKANIFGFSDIVISIPSYDNTGFDWELWRRTVQNAPIISNDPITIRWMVMGVK